MKRHSTKGLHPALRRRAVLPAALLGIGLALPAPALRAADTELEEVLVTARRKQESIQDVPISVTVFDQQSLDERNVVSAADLVKYAPSLNVNTRFGSDQASFAIRGFTQEFRTTASVGVYFADVVAPRGGAVITAGDGAGPGAFFDLKNVQVLKGPQGTLFGRNTTGGAILLVPQEPTSELEGYGEVSAGNENMQRLQGVLNVPISDSLRARFGIDSMQRDGYMKNVSRIGPDRMTDIDYLAGRASVVWDLSDAVQNYSILSYADSKNNGTLQGLFVCKPNGLLDSVCQPTLALQKDDFYKIASDSPNPVSKFEQWQFINTTTWELGRALTVKNILSYADLEQTMRTANFGSDFKIPPLYAPVLANPALVGAPLSFYPATAPEGLPSNSQTTFVEELQFSGDALDDRLSWQAGLYYENSQPDGWSGILSYVFLTCENPPSGSLPSWQCIDAFGQGFVQSSLAKIEYTNMAAYTQGTYEISEQFRVTLGLRYTVDDTSGKNSQTTYTGFPRGTPGAPVNTACVLSPASATLPECRQHLDHSSDAPTGLIDVDYLPTPDLMLYAKYARGYRQGSINMFAPEGVQTYEPEEVDAWEIGSKWSFEAPLAGTLNIALFYNELTDQQLQYGYEGGGRSATTAIVNAGASTIQGAEIETTLELYEDLVFNLSYTWLDTKLDKINAPQLVPPYTDIQEPTNEGSELTFSPENTVVMSLNYRLPLAADVGDVTVGTSYTFIDEQLAIYGTYGMLDSRKLLNLNASWTGIMGSDFDASLFATNVTDEEYPVNVTGFYDNPNVAMDFRVTGEPRMVGARLRYNFR